MPAVLIYLADGDPISASGLFPGAFTRDSILNRGQAMFWRVLQAWSQENHVVIQQECGRLGNIQTWMHQYCDIRPSPGRAMANDHPNQKKFRTPLHFALECEMAPFLSNFTRCTELDEKRRVADMCRFHHYTLLSGKPCPAYGAPGADEHEREPVIYLSNEAQETLDQGRRYRLADLFRVPSSPAAEPAPQQTEPVAAFLDPEEGLDDLPPGNFQAQATATPPPVEGIIITNFRMECNKISD